MKWQKELQRALIKKSMARYGSEMHKSFDNPQTRLILRARMKIIDERRKVELWDGILMEKRRLGNDVNIIECLLRACNKVVFCKNQISFFVLTNYSWFDGSRKARVCVVGRFHFLISLALSITSNIGVWRKSINGRETWKRKIHWGKMCFMRFPF